MTHKFFQMRRFSAAISSGVKLSVTWPLQTLAEVKSEAKWDIFSKVKLIN